MATIKSYTSLEQSRKLAEFLPLESADMFYTSLNSDYPWIWIDKHLMEVEDIPCWSLSALLGVIPYNVSFNNAVYRFKLVKFSTHWECYHENFGSVSTGIFKADNPVDACVEMILKLHEEKML